MSWLRLLRSRRVGVTTFWRLMDEHGSATAALDALPQVARAAGTDNYLPCTVATALAEMAEARRAGARMLFRGEADYPADLATLSDAPPFLWAIGEISALRRPMVALVGARNSSSLGSRMARRLAAELGEAGFVVVSGLARGIDTAAHLAARDTGTVAVMAGGVDMIYPAENTRLADDIVARGGARVSEQPMGVQPQARHFPTRNRIVAGMARGVVVVEAAAKSGSLITARLALDIGREVLAVPGHPLDARAGGCNILIREGARLVRGAQDVLEALPPDEAQTVLPLTPPVAAHSQPRSPKDEPQFDPQPARESPLRHMARLHDAILARLGPSPIAEDQLIRDLGATAGHVAPVLTDLELDGRVQRQPGGLLSLLPPA